VTGPLTTTGTVRRGIVLAGGTGSRLFPMTLPICKQLLPVFDKPMVYYPVAVLMLAGVREILLISTETDVPRFERLFGDGAHLGVRFTYAAQASPRGIAEAILIGADFIADESFFLALGDNILYGQGLSDLLQAEARRTDGATIFSYTVADPRDYGVVEVDEADRPIAVVEKPAEPRSNQAIVGLYRYDAQAVALTRSLRPSPRGELEITDLNRAYLEQGRLTVRRLGRGVAWLDAGTPTSLLQAGTFVQTVEERQGLKIACLEEIAFLYGYIDRAALTARARTLSSTDYGRYLSRLADDPEVARRRAPSATRTA